MPDALQSRCQSARQTTSKSFRIRLHAAHSLGFQSKVAVNRISLQKPFVFFLLLVYAQGRRESAHAASLCNCGSEIKTCIVDALSLPKIQSDMRRQLCSGQPPCSLPELFAFCLSLLTPAGQSEHAPASSRRIICLRSKLCGLLLNTLMPLSDNDDAIRQPAGY